MHLAGDARVIHASCAGRRRSGGDSPQENFVARLREIQPNSDHVEASFQGHTKLILICQDDILLDPIATPYIRAALFVE
jgi:hypothetical protein